MRRVLALLVVTLLGSAPAFAFRCGSRLVHEGDTRAEVIAKCGEPADVVARSVWRQPILWFHGRPFQVGNDLIEVPVETWTYNLGPNRLMRIVRFEDGLVVDIDTGGYGYR
ncbi:MAG: DUF2845 domain-containing protein [Steroidobacteraceae bacterium]